MHGIYFIPRFCLQNPTPSAADRPPRARPVRPYTRIWLRALRETWRWRSRLPTKYLQWRNRQGGQGAECPQRLLTGKVRQGEKGKMEQKRRKIEKGEVENWKWKDEKLQNEDKTFFTFQNDWNLFWVYQNGNFLPGKSISRREKIRKNAFPPSEKYSSYTPEYLAFMIHPWNWGLRGRTDYVQLCLNETMSVLVNMDYEFSFCRKSDYVQYQTLDGVPAPPFCLCPLKCF